MRRWAAAVVLGIAIVAVASPSSARALFAEGDSAAADTTLDDFLGTLSDSTDRYFGELTAAPPDTAGLDSALAWGLENDDGSPSRPLRISFGPWFGFNRVDGPLYGGVLGLTHRDLGHLQGRLGWAAGPNEWLGGGEYRKFWGGRRRSAAWSFTASGGRLTSIMDSDRRESLLNTTRALLSGADRQHYLQRVGYRLALRRETSLLRLGAGFRDEVERPLVTTATWNLTDRTPVVVDNLAAFHGRAREIQTNVTVRLPFAPVWIDGTSRVSDEAFGSDFDYTRTRLAVAAEVPVGTWATVVPQATWGRLIGDATPQASFFFGGSHSMRSVPGASLGGTGEAFARTDVIATADLLTTIRIPHPELLVLQGGVFGAVGAVWGRDPYGGPGTTDQSWPEQEQWLSEVGVAILYRPGLPEPHGFFKFEYGWPIGHDDRTGRLVVSYSRVIDQLRVMGQ